MTNVAHRWIESARRGAQWIVQRQNPDGSFFDVEAGIGGYYKVPYTLALSGYVPEAVRLLRWVRAHHFTPDGDFRAPQRKATLSAHDEWPTYANAWLIQGAHRVGQYDLSLRGARYLLGHQVPCGGYHAFAPKTHVGMQPYVECVGTSWSGLAQLTVGNLDAAKAAACCLQALVDQQKDPSRFYFRMTVDGELITNVPDGKALSYYVDVTRQKQIYYQPGIALIFLCRYYSASNDTPVLEAAQDIFAFTQRCAEDVYCFPPSGKLGVGCALLAAATGDAAAGKGAQAVADYLVSTQTDEGCWVLPDEEVYRAFENKQDPEVVMDITAEFAAFLWEIAALR